MQFPVFVLERRLPIDGCLCLQVRLSFVLKPDPEPTRKAVSTTLRGFLHFGSAGGEVESGSGGFGAPFRTVAGWFWWWAKIPLILVRVAAWSHVITDLLQASEPEEAGRGTFRAQARCTAGAHDALHLAYFSLPVEL